MKWKADRGAWERDAASRGKSSSGGEERKAKAPSQDKSVSAFPAVEATPVTPPNTRIVSIPIRDGFDVTFVVPKDLKINEVRKIAYVLAGYVVDYDPTTTKALQTLLDFKGSNPGVNNS